MTKVKLTKLLKGVSVKDLREKCIEMEMECYEDDAIDLIRDTLEGKHPLMPIPRTRKGVINEIADWINIKAMDDETIFEQLNIFGFVQADDGK